MVSQADGIMKTMESKIETSGTHAKQPWPEKIYRKGWMVGRLEERSFWVNSPPYLFDEVKYGWQWLLLLGFPTLWIVSFESTHCTHAVPPLWAQCNDMVATIGGPSASILHQYIVSLSSMWITNPPRCDNRNNCAFAEPFSRTFEQPSAF